MGPAGRRVPVVVGLAAMVVGALDPLEGSLVLVPCAVGSNMELIGAIRGLREGSGRFAPSAAP